MTAGTDALDTLLLVGVGAGGSAAAFRSGDPTLDRVLVTETVDGRPVAPELRLLLAVGVRTVLGAAARIPATASRAARVAPAPRDPRPPATPRLATLLAELIAQGDPLLPEACATLAARGRRLPDALVVPALSVRDAAARDALRPVLGARGSWLAERVPALGAGAAAGAEVSLDSLRASFEEGTPAVRVNALGRARRLDPAAARGWLEASYAAEKADARASFLDALSAGLGPEDEALLERALDDRSEKVREAARALLGRLPGSAFVERMSARADACLSQKRSAFAVFGKGPTLTLTPPETIDDAAERDGLPAKVAAGVAKRATWLARIVAATPLERWKRVHGAAPEAVLAAALAARDWARPAVDGLTAAAVIASERDSTFLDALHAAWLREDLEASPAERARALVSLLAVAPPERAGARVAALIASGARGELLAQVLAGAPAPWSAPLADAFLGRAEKLLAEHHVLFVLPACVRAVPPARLEHALRTLEAADEGAGRAAIVRAVEILRARVVIHQEPPA